ncbi:uncharacterized protein LOC106075758 [Biomphalaria glabrata]|uniref:Uncharacterized protein LOC106075758 n=1 Tax=Biomphalaria glabrata TaxID=6526 RepID=A0A9W2ZVF7_BIOGL|nr:uncharacterized protein LOC106075758 [Biomphalaria glabrata]XP_055879044.1 uncharacterized protein LOC106075758 [Biomphalaria glabrata]
MELPRHYLPARTCPHVGIDLYQRLLFADYGSYQNVNVSVDVVDTKEIITSWPQRGQKSIQDLNKILPTLPLFDQPLQELWRERDNILGVKNFNDTLSSIKQLLKLTRLKNTAIKKRDKKFEALKKTYKHSGESALDFSDDVTLQKMMTHYSEVSLAYNDNCLNGYNRDFYNGQLSVISNNRDEEYISYVGGPDMKEMYITTVSQEPDSCLKTPHLVCQQSAEERINQLETRSTCYDELFLVCAREKQMCELFLADMAGRTLVPQGSVRISDDCWTSISFSNYLENELLLTSSSGDVFLWDISSSSEKIVYKSSRFDCPDKWSCAYFAGHPREIVVADNTSVEIFDHRSNFQNGQELFSLSTRFITVNEKVMAAGFLDFPYHAVVTDYSLFVMDQRFGSSPVFHWSTEFKAAPQYLQIIDNVMSPGKLIFLASQQPAEVICFPIDIDGGDIPKTSLLPWKVSAIGDFSQSEHHDYVCEVNVASRKFQTSLAGLAVTKMSNENVLTVYQMDSYGDIFFQTVNFNHSQTKVNPSSELDRQSARVRINEWLRNLDKTIKSGHGEVTPDMNVHKETFDPEFLKDILQTPASLPLNTASVQMLQLHNKIKPLHKLSQKGSNTQLLLALRDGADIHESLKKREDDHEKKKKKMRKKHILEQKKKTYRKRRKGKSLFSDLAISSDSSTAENIAAPVGSCRTDNFASSDEEGTFDNNLVVTPSDRQLRNRNSLANRSTISVQLSDLMSENEDELFDSSGSLFDVNNFTDSDSDSSPNQANQKMIVKVPRVKSSKSVSPVWGLCSPNTHLSKKLIGTKNSTSTPNKRKPKRNHLAATRKRPCQDLNSSHEEINTHSLGQSSPKLSQEAESNLFNHQPLINSTPILSHKPQEVLALNEASDLSQQAVDMSDIFSIDTPVAESISPNGLRGKSPQVGLDESYVSNSQDTYSSGLASQLTPLFQRFNLSTGPNELKLAVEDGFRPKTLFKDSSLLRAQIVQNEPVQGELEMTHVSATQETFLTQNSAISNLFTSSLGLGLSSDLSLNQSPITDSQELFPDNSSTTHISCSQGSCQTIPDTQFTLPGWDLNVTHISATQNSTLTHECHVSLLDKMLTQSMSSFGDAYNSTSRLSCEPPTQLQEFSEPVNEYHDVLQWLHDNPSPKHATPPLSWDRSSVTIQNLNSWGPEYNNNSCRGQDSDSESMELVCSSLPPSLTRVTLASTRMKCLVDPNLAGFLSSPFNIRKRNTANKTKQLK